jgi:hypothetical protein
MHIPSLLLGFFVGLGVGLFYAKLHGDWQARDATERLAEKLMRERRERQARDAALKSLRHNVEDNLERSMKERVATVRLCADALEALAEQTIGGAKRGATRSIDRE